MLFTYRQIAELNETETFIYQYVIKNISAVAKMSIRKLADDMFQHATIVRFVKN